MPTLHDSPAHQHEADPLRRLSCRDVVRIERPFVSVAPEATVSALSRQIENAPDQDVFPVVDGRDTLRGLVSAEALRVVASNPEVGDLAIVADVMTPRSRSASTRTCAPPRRSCWPHDVRSIPVVDEAGAIVGLLDEHDIAAVLVKATRQPCRTAERGATRCTCSPWMSEGLHKPVQRLPSRRTRCPSRRDSTPGGRSRSGLWPGAARASRSTSREK